ncbi:uncharacterized protein LOC123465010 isoform X2 [Bubalus bubalis]|nr:uncharacterized protein LOC123465010 isoform X2 [Bubalus bubalis]
MARLLGCAVAVALILSVASTVFFLYHWQQKNRLEMDGAGTALPLSQEPEPSPSRQSHLALENIQILGPELEKQQLQQEEDEPQKLPPQPPYYDLGASPSYHPLALRAKRVLETADQCKRVALPVRTEPQPGAQLSLLQPCPPPSSVPCTPVPGPASDHQKASHSPSSWPCSQPFRGPAST